MTITTKTLSRETLSGQAAAGVPHRPPLGWGADGLTTYLDDCRRNQFATFNNKPDAVADLVRIDALFVKFLDGAINPRPFMPMNFMLRAHSSFRVAAGSVLAGQVYEAQAQLRLCLEHGAYGFYIGDNKDRWQRWMNRSTSDEAKQAVRQEFSHTKVAKHIQAAATKLGDLFEHLYDRLIDFGAHPNELGFSSNSAVREDGENVHFDTIYLQGDGLPLDLALKTTGQVGLWVLHIMQLQYRERYDLLGIKQQVEEIRQRF